MSYIESNNSTILHKHNNLLTHIMEPGCSYRLFELLLQFLTFIFYLLAQARYSSGTDS
jgi:hypothetical protein